VIFIRIPCIIIMKKHLSFLYIILAGIFWGTSGIFVDLLVPYGFTSPQMTFFRAFTSVVFIGGYAAIKNRKLFCVSKKNIWLFLGGGIGLFGTGTFYYFSMQATSVSTAVVLMYTAPVLVMIFSVAFLGEKLTKLKVVSVISMLLGCCLVSGIIGGLKMDLFGILVGLLSGISYSAYNIFTKLQMRKKTDPITSTFYCFLVTAVISACVCDPLSIPERVAEDPAFTLPVIILLGICTYVLPYFFYTNALKELPVGTASALSIVEPMSATLFGVLLLGEKLNVFSVCGILLIIGSVFLLSRSEK